MIDFSKVNVRKPEETLTYKELIEVANYVANNVFEDGIFRQYLMDYVNTSAVINMFTDYDGDMHYEDIIGAVGSKELNYIISKIIDVNGDKYSKFNKYVASMIEEKSKPMSSFNKTLDALTKVLKASSNLIEGINPELLDESSLKTLFDSLVGNNNE